MRSLLVVGSIVIATATVACTTKRSKEERLHGLVSAMPWMMQMLEYCEAYKGAKADANKADLATAAASILRTASVENIQGKIERLYPNRPQDPSEYSLQIKVGDDARFATQSGKRPLTKDDSLFQVVATMKAGQCVIFSADDLEPIAPFQQGRICNPRYYARFLTIEPCP